MAHLDRIEIQEQLQARGIDPNHIRALHVKLQTGELDHTSFVIESNRLRAPQPSDVLQPAQYHNTATTEAGIQALQQDHLLVFWLNGGAATRYFDQTKIQPDEQARYTKALGQVDEDLRQAPKGVTPVVQSFSYIELKIRNLLAITERYQLSVHPQVVIMNSFITDETTRAHVQALFKKYPTLQPNRFHFIVQQPTIPRFQKVEDLKNIDLFVHTDGQLSWAPCGHGDFIYLLQDYLRRTHIPNVQYLFFANIDNVGATIDPQLLGQHIAAKVGRTVELADKNPGDQGGAPCYVDNQLIIVEQMKFPTDFDQTNIAWFNTNTFWFTLKDLLDFQEDLPLILAEKTIPEGDVIQLEHFACDVNVSSQYVVVPRQQRFWPIKRYVDALIYQDLSLSGEQQKLFQELLQKEYQLVTITIFDKTLKIV